MIRIAYIVTRFPKLSETFVFREINALRRHGADVLCFSIHQPEREPLPLEARHFLEETTYLYPPPPVQFVFGILKFAAQRARPFFSTLCLYLRRAPRNPKGIKRFLLHFLEGVYLAHLCTQRNVTYIHAHFANGPSSVAMAASALSGIPFGFTCHAQDIYADTLMLDLKIARARLALTISEYNRYYLKKNFSLRNPTAVQVQRVAIDLAQFRPRLFPPLRKEPPLILAIGRLVPKKGFIYLIRACEMLARQRANFRCWIIGEGPERKTLQTAIAAANLQDRVHLLGAQADVKKFLRHADLFVMPCVVDKSGDRDGIPTTLMEAMAMTVPVISTNVSAIPELIFHERNGLLVRPSDPETLAIAIRRLLDDVELRETLTKRARRYVEHFHNLETNTRRLLHRILAVTQSNLYENCVDYSQIFTAKTPSLPSRRPGFAKNSTLP